MKLTDRSEALSRMSYITEMHDSLSKRTSAIVRMYVHPDDSQKKPEYMKLGTLHPKYRQFSHSWQMIRKPVCYFRRVR